VACGISEEQQDRALSPGADLDSLKVYDYYVHPYVYLLTDFMIRGSFGLGLGVAVFFSHALD